MLVVAKVRWFCLCGVLLLVLANGAHASQYLRTREGTLVWDNPRGPGYEATWSGNRDRKRYATGEGTLTWYRLEQRLLTGSIIPFWRGNGVIVGSFSGKMLHGKFDGMVVSVDASGKTFHARFVDGRKTKDWEAGPAPLPTEQPAEQVQQDVVAAGEPETKPPALVARPSPTPHEKASQGAPGSVAKATPSPAMDDSLRSLISPPSLLRMKAMAEASPKESMPAKEPSSAQASVPPTTSSSPPGPSLNATEVIDLADAEARTQGYDLGEYQRPQAHYTAKDGTWSVSYAQKYVDGMGEVGTPFSVTVEDKTKKISIVRDR
jgi:hypothetical protein